uniref:NADH dehydrogenase subunit 6 n=1 Tax=Pediopsoides anchorides TaxID=3035251 RepID=UPI00241171E3|nr:NADH dehydrogenase subunit 6 [Pediopsoides anchorides]WEP24781.1 NADH dehydrogenase subunit 6 [Pediopsoides anchorides]
MKFLLLKMMLLNSIILPIMKTPLSMGTTLIMQTIMATMLMNKMMLTAWFPMVTFLMMIGGMMVLFMYMSSIAANEKFKMNLNMTIMLILMIIITEEFLMENQINEKQKMMYMEIQETYSMLKLYNKKSMMITMFLVMFLLLTMVSVSKIVLHHKGPLRMKTYE